MHFKPLLFAAIFMLLFSTNLRAQIKIGTNSSIIEPNSNLEVEASTSGRKFTIDKSTGQVTIADGTQEFRKVLVSDADGKAKWDKLLPESLYGFPKLRVNGVGTDALEDGTRVDMKFSKLSFVQGGFLVDQSGPQNLYEGWYHIEATLNIENSEGCTGTSVMGLEVNLVRNGVTSEVPVLDEKLTPVYQDKYVTKVSLIKSLLYRTIVGLSILPTIKSSQPGCTIKVASSSLIMTYIP